MRTDGKIAPRLIADGLAACLLCGRHTPHKPPKYRGLYCSNACQQGDVFLRLTVPKIEAGSIRNRSTLYCCLVWRDGNACNGCGITDWRGQPLRFEVDHKDGCAANDEGSNLQLLCPNCHALTPHHGGRNRGRGRGSLGLSWR